MWWSEEYIIASIQNSLDLITATEYLHMPIRYDAGHRRRTRIWVRDDASTGATHRRICACNLFYIDPKPTASASHCIASGFHFAHGLPWAHILDILHLRIWIRKESLLEYFCLTLHGARMTGGWAEECRKIGKSEKRLLTSSCCVCIYPFATAAWMANKRECRSGHALRMASIHIPRRRNRNEVPFPSPEINRRRDSPLQAQTITK